MATFPDLVNGSKLRLHRTKDDNSANELICAATTIGFTRSTATEKITQQDCDNPGALPWETTVKTSRSWGITISGKCDPKRFELLEEDYNSEGYHAYYLTFDRTAAAGGKSYSGQALVTELAISRSDNATITFTATLVGTFALNTTPAAA